MNNRRLEGEKLEAEDEKHEATKNTNDEIVKREDEAARYEREKLNREEEKKRADDATKGANVAKLVTIFGFFGIFIGGIGFYACRKFMKHRAKSNFSSMSGPGNFV
jgi:hypothetical protein